MSEFDIHYAEGPNGEDTGLPPQLMAGDTPAVVTQDYKITVSGSTIKQFTPLKRDNGAGFVPWTAGSSVDAIAAFDLPVGTYRKCLYTAGMFNIDAINWPEGTTEAQAELAQTGMIRYRKLLYSDQRTGNESAYVGPGNEAGGQPFAFQADSATLPASAEGAAYSFDVDSILEGGSGVRTFSLDSGTFPSGVSINTSTGVISGTVGASASGTYHPVIKVVDAEGNTISQTFTLVIADT